MKKLNRCLALAVALLLTVTPAFADRSDAKDAGALPGCYRYVTAGQAVMYAAADMPVYAQPSSSAAVIGQAASDSLVNVVSVNANRDWALITTETLPTGGWIPASLLVMEETLTNNAVIVAGAAGLRVNLRTAPTVNSPTQGKYYTGTLCEILNPTPVMDGNTAYVYVRIGSLTGYVDSRRLVDGIANSWTELPVIMVRNQYGTQNALYGQPDWAAQAVGYVTNGTYVTVLGIRGDGWYHVMCDGMEGFIQSSVLLQQLPWDLDAVDTVTSSTVTLPAGEDSLYVVSSQPGNRVNLRSKPSTSSVSLCKYYTGTPVTQLGDVVDGYMYVGIGHLKGYMDVRFLAYEPNGRESELIRCMVQPTQGAVSAAMYRWNDAASEIVWEIPYGEEIIMIGIDDTWAHIVYRNTHGFIQRSELYQLSY